MITADEVKKLAGLARIELQSEEIPALQKDLESILAYVSELGSVEVGEIDHHKLDYLHRNVFREDDAKFGPDQWTPGLLAQAPTSRDRFWSVKKILDQNFDV